MQIAEYVVLVEADNLDIESLRDMAYAASWKYPRQRTGHRDEKQDNRIAFCFEGHLAALRFDHYCAQNGVKRRRIWPENSN
jgi:hypothetical protein